MTWWDAVLVMALAILAVVCTLWSGLTLGRLAFLYFLVRGAHYPRRHYVSGLIAVTALCLAGGAALSAVLALLERG